MLLITLRDLQWRLRRFVVAGVGAALVFALTIVLTSLSHTFQVETRRTVDVVGADGWVVQEGVEGVFTTLSVVPATLAGDIATRPGVRRADPIVVVHQTVPFGGLKDVNVIGYAEGGLGTPRLSAGRLPSSSGELVVDDSLGAEVGQELLVSGRPFEVVGLTSGLTYNAGQPLAFVRLADAQRVFVKGAQLASAIVTEGLPATLPEGYVVRDREATRRDMLRPLGNAVGSVRLMAVLLWCVAGLVIGSVVYLSAIERARDFAVYKATGWSTRTLAAGLGLEAVLLSVTASLVGVVLAQVIVPVFPLPLHVPALARLLLPVVGLVVGLLASAVGLRRAVGTDPALAFGGQS